MARVTMRDQELRNDNTHDTLPLEMLGDTLREMRGIREELSHPDSTPADITPLLPM